MTETALDAALAELGSLLTGYEGFSSQLRPAASEGAVHATAHRLGVDPLSESLVTLYGWHDGAAPEDPSQRAVFVFPPDWNFVSLETAELEASFPLEWCQQNRITGFPFAKHDTGMFLVAAPDESVWQVSWDLFMPAWPDGTMLGLVNGTCRALRGEDKQFAPQITAAGLEWTDD